jgi:hypothetical protein
MADLNFKLTFNLGDALDGVGIINKQIFPLLNQAVRAVAAQTAANWQANVYQAKLWSGEKDAYAKTIGWHMTGDFTALVESDYRYDQEIENGRPAKDLKKMLGTSLKVRRTEDGRRFLIIPLRHNVAKLEAAGIYNMAKDLDPSTILEQSERPSGEVTNLSPTAGMSPSTNQTPYLSNAKTKSTMMVNKNHYSWGGSLKKSNMRAGMMPGTRAWAQGMHRFDTSTPGGGKSSAYLTFRVMMEGSGGWIVPPQPGQQIAQKTSEDMQQKALSAFEEAIKRTVTKMQG